MKRLLDCNSSDFINMSKRDLLKSIALSEGRVIVTEMIGLLQPILFDISNAELASAFGADILLLNLFDVHNPIFNGIPKTSPIDIVEQIKKLTGRPIGINLEAVDETESPEGERSLVSSGRKASAKTARIAFEMGVDMIVLTGNPSTCVTNKGIVNSIKEIRNELGDEIILVSGKMHGAGVLGESGENICTKEDVIEFINAGTDIILLPAPGTVPGIAEGYIKDLISLIHSHNKLAMTTIGTSQEGADSDTIKRIALMCKICGADIHHLGDAGYAGIAIPENIMDYSIAIRGKRHTYTRMARSINR